MFLRKVRIWRKPMTGVLGVSIFIGMLLLCVTVNAAPMPMNGEDPVSFQAKQLSHDDENQIVTAIGDVELIQGEKILRADKVVYDLNKDIVQAIGNVSLLDETGDIHFAEYVELKNQMKEGFVQSLLSLLSDGSRFTAIEGERVEGVTTKMTDATYTPCNVCETNPEPLWQIKASEVEHDVKEKTVNYKNARFEFAGVPFLYTPVFSHADPSVKRKSGFTRPRYGFSSSTGTFVEGGYYFGDIAPDKDATINIRPTALKGVLTQGEWRQRFERGRIQLNGSVVQSDRIESYGGTEENKIRGHLFGEGRFDLDEKWRAGFDVRQSSDKNYLRLYDISSENFLNSKVYVERFSDRDYSQITARSYRDVRLGERPEQPNVFPEAEHRMVGAAGGTLGGRWDAGASVLSLQRGEKDAQDVQRLASDIGWERRDVNDNGIVTRVHGRVRGDLYNVVDNTQVAPGIEDDTTKGRASAVAGVMASYPMVKRQESASILLEPVIGLNASPSVDNTDTDIPNEDSLDVQLDTSNIFSENRYVGLDRQEDGIRANYGLKTGVYADDGRYGRAFIGQSYRFDDDAAFARGSGLENKSSDVVGSLGVGVAGLIEGDYRFQLDSERLNIQRHEASVRGYAGPMTVTSRYIYDGGVVGTDFAETREQVQLGANYRFNDNWSSYANSLTDLGQEPGLRRGSLGVAYSDECFSMSLAGGRNLTSDASGESETTIMLRVGFKNIGEFYAPEIMLQGQKDE